MQPNLRSPLARAALCFALSTMLGVAAPALGASAKINVTSLAQFGVLSSVGAGVRGDLIVASDGNVYAAASSGGASGYGSVVQITPTGTVTAIHSFAGPGTEASTPYAGVIQATDGNLYGTSYFGGANNLGTVYRVTLTGDYTNLYSFDNASQGGFFPYAGLVQGPGGDLYGTTLRGGAADAGTVFKISLSGTLTTLVSFDGTNGKNPEGQLVVGADGSLYGTTLIGGDADRGVIFKITPAGVLTKLFSFPSLGAFNTSGVATNAVGANPRAGLKLGADGNFYGTAYQGGPAGYGTVFKSTPAGAVTVVHGFSGPPGDGAFPLSTVSQTADGSFFGTTEQGGALGAGTTWRIDAAGTYQVLHSFTTLLSDGQKPYATLTPGNGVLYGVGFSDSTLGSGVVFRAELPASGAALPVTLTVTPETMTLGSPATLTWSSPTASSCTATGSWTDTIATSGSLTVTPTLGRHPRLHPHLHRREQREPRHVREPRRHDARGHAGGCRRRRQRRRLLPDPRARAARGHAGLFPTRKHFSKDAT